MVLVLSCPLKDMAGVTVGYLDKETGHVAGGVSVQKTNF